MPLNIKNEDTERRTRKLAEITGESLTETVRVSVSERYDRLTRGKSGRTLSDELTEIALRCARLPVISDLSADEILGYDESGIPSR